MNGRFFLGDQSVGHLFDLRLDLADALLDRVDALVQPLALGGHGVLIPTLDTMPGDILKARAQFSIATTLDEVVRRILETPA